MNVSHSVPGSLNTLHQIASNASISLPQLFKLADETQEGRAIRSAIAQALIEKTIPNNWTGLHQIARYAPASLPALLKLADETQEGEAIRFAITETLIEKTMQASSTPIHQIARYAPDSLPKLLKIASNTKGLQFLFRALNIANSEGITGWQMIRKHAVSYKQDILNVLLNQMKQIADDSPTSLADTLFLVLDNDENKESLHLALLALAVTTPNGLTVWQIIEKYSISQKEKIITKLSNKLEELDTESLLEVGSNILGALSDQNSSYHGICKKRHTFFLFNEYGKTMLWQELMNKIKSILQNRMDHQNDCRFQELTTTKENITSKTRWDELHFLSMY